MERSSAQLDQSRKHRRLHLRAAAGTHVCRGCGRGAVDLLLQLNLLQLLLVHQAQLLLMLLVLLIRVSWHTNAARLNTPQTQHG